MIVAPAPIPIWGGFECTVARIGDDYRDQLRETGQLERPLDIAWVAKLGIRTLRHPVLWEHVHAAGAGRAEWGLQDERLAALRERGITPIAGLLHHGSGPRHTSLLDPDFPLRFADFAAEVAQRYPWVTRFTPINEPLTTARFSCLYGHWYPHLRDTAAFLRAVFHQVRATVLAMQRIRQGTAAAQLIQTEDIGKVFATSRLRYQARYENSRRWLSLDLLCGRVGPDHPWFTAFIEAGISPGALLELTEAPCPPDVIGINHYLSSDRHLDGRYWRYRASALGGNGRHSYADIEATRVPSARPELGVGARIKEVWQRYRLAIALTEVHNGCTREEQLRWLIEAARAAAAARADGIDIKALTVWALAGLVDWDSLLTRRDGHYESGVIEVFDGKARGTALAAAVTSLVATGSYDHPVLDGRGWWQAGESRQPPTARAARRLLLLGGTDALALAFSAACLSRDLAYDVVDGAAFDICHPDAVRRALTECRPWAVIRATRLPAAQEVERDPERSRREHSVGPEVLARACADFDIPLLTFSSDRVFDGRLGRPYVEADLPSATAMLGALQAEGERRVLAAWDRALIVRAGEFFGSHDRSSFLSTVLSALEAGREVILTEESRITPSYLPDLVHRALDLLIDGESGIWHLANAGPIWRGDLARGAAARAGLPASLIKRGRCVDASTALASDRGPLLPSLASALDRFFVERGSP